MASHSSTNRIGFPDQLRLPECLRKYVKLDDTKRDVAFLDSRQEV